MSDKELDKLFQEAASGLEPAYDPQDWEMLRARLDGDDKAAFVRRITLRILVGAMLLSSVWSAWQSGDTNTSPQEAAVVETTTLFSAGVDTALGAVPTPRGGTGTQAHAISGTTMEGPSNTGTAHGKDTVRTGSTGIAPEAQTKQALAGNTKVKNAAAANNINAEANHTTTNTADPDNVDASSNNKTGQAGQQVTNHRRRVQRQNAAPTSEENNAANYTGRTGQVNVKDSLIAVQRVAGRPVDVTVRKGSVAAEQSHTSTKATPIAGVQAEATGDVKDDEKEAAGTTKQGLTLEHNVAAIDKNTPAGSVTREDAARTTGEEDQQTALTEKNRQQPALNTATKDNTLVAVGVQAYEKNRSLHPETQEVERDGQHQTDTAQALDRDARAGKADDVYVREKDNMIGVNGPPMRKRNKGETIEGKEALVAAVQQDSTHVKEGEKKDSTHVAAAQEEEEKAGVKSSRWYIKLAVSPDFSTIGYTRPGKPGINLGLQVEFMPVRRIGISAGAIWSRKIYTSKNPEKTYGSGAYQVKADWLDGECRVLDLPLNVTYYIRPEARTNFSVTAGISSYLMLSEDYTYGVKGPAKDYLYNEKFTRKNNDWASMLNLSIGIQHRLSRRFLVQAEPFLKAPLSGVGEGKVDLVSSGVFFSLKYQL